MHKSIASFMPLTILLFMGCSLIHDKGPSASDQNWQRFVSAVTDLQSWDDKGYTETHFRAQKLLNLEQYNWGYGGKLIIAEPPRTEAIVKPEPEVWKTADYILACSADICGDPRPEYVFGMGWFGPTGGVLCLYDSELRTIAKVEMGWNCLWGVRLQDLTDEGKNEILCWSDSHRGSGEWIRRLTIYKYIDNVGLKLVWEGELYGERSRFIDKYEIKIHKEKDRSAIIVKNHMLSQSTYYPDGVHGVVSLDKTNPPVTYVWNSSSNQFEEKK